MRLEAGDIAVTLGPDHWTACDEPSTAPQAVIHPGQRCTTPDGRILEQEMHQGVRSWGNSPEGQTVLLTGAYLMEGEVSHRLIRALPRMLVLRADELRSPLVPLLADEIVRDEPGQDAVLDRLQDLLLIAVLRTWFARPEAEPPAWYVGQADPLLGPALRLLQHHPAHAWTVAELASAAGASRASFARRFTDVVGQPPWPSSPGGALRSPRTCSANPTPRSAPWPVRSATARRSHSAPPSSERTGSALVTTVPRPAEPGRDDLVTPPRPPGNLSTVSVAAWALSALLLTTGTLHFVAPAGFESIVPGLLGAPAFWVRASGVAELGCAASLVFGLTRRVAGWACVVLFVAVLPANVTMALDSLHGHGSGLVAWLRLPLQIPLVLWAGYVARGSSRG